MKYLYLPIHLIEFWYPESIAFFMRAWKNLMLYLEEDLAVGLMFKLLFVPLFHDATIVGRVLSFIFRVIRILLGLFAFALATILVLLVAFYWLFLPIFAVLDIPVYLSQALLFAGIGLFILHIWGNPHKKVWQIAGKENLWETSLIKSNEISLKNLLLDKEVLSLLDNLEVEVRVFPKWEIQDLGKVAIDAYKLAKKTGSQYLRPVHFFVVSLKQIPNIGNFLLKLDLRIEDFEDTLFYLEKKRNIWRKVFIWDEDFVIYHLKGVNRGWLGAPTPNLDLVAEDLTKKAAKGEFADFTFIRSNGIVENTVNILSQQTGRNVLVMSLPGAGKTALVRHLAKQIVQGNAPSSLAIKRLMLLDLTKLLSGVKNQGELAGRIKTIFEEVEFAQNVIVVIEEIHDLGIGEAGSTFNLYSLMLPYIESDTFQFIATTEPGNYVKILEKNGSFARLFIKVELPPASLDDTIKILESRAIAFERKNKIKTTYLAIKEAARLAQKLVHDRVLPDSAISIFKEAQIRAVNHWVTQDSIKRVVSERVKVPLMEAASADKTRLLNLEKEIHRQLINQEQAVKVVSDALRRSATGLREEERPIGSFLFVGPTGVGKTELAKTLAEVYFKTEGAFLRFDMSEYQNQESVSRLIGGADEGGLLTEAVRNRPYALLLLDEFEKAHSKILTLFLQVLEDGRLTDGAGRLIDFTNTIIIATSNAGSLIIAQGLEANKNWEALDKQISDELLKVFKPELINRFDDVVLFKPLSAEELQKIVQIKMLALQNQMKAKGYLVEFDDALVNELARRGFDPIMGARPLRRLIQDTLEAKLSKLILENKLAKGQSFKVSVDLL